MSGRPCHKHCSPRPIFRSLQAVQRFTGHHPGYQEKVLKFFVGGEGEEPIPHFLVMTGVAGFCNHFAGLARQGNVKLVAYPKRGLGDKLFVL